MVVLEQDGVAQLPSLLLASAVAQVGGSFFSCQQLCKPHPVQIYCVNELHSHMTTVLIPSL